ncbi:MAG TPA: hypothetical protein VFM18_07420 [Methanosarcina sp.]|nr:hypothetical protein [Methanosarcina sp.]
MSTFVKENTPRILNEMRKVKKTVCMPKARFEKWVEALRSGSYLQGRSALKQEIDETCSFCCLGLEQHINAGYVESGEGMINGKPFFNFLSLPTPEYLVDNDIVYDGVDGTSTCCSPTVWKDGSFCSVAYLNDSGVSFEEIAGILEKHFISLEEIKELLEKESI